MSGFPERDFLNSEEKKDALLTSIELLRDREARLFEQAAAADLAGNREEARRLREKALKAFRAADGQAKQLRRL